MMKTSPVRVLVLSTAVVVLMLSSAQAGWFGWGDKEDSSTRRFHRDVANEAVGKELSQFMAMKQILIKEKQFLQVLAEEKRQALVDVDAEMTRSFGIKPDRNYRYDEKAMTISEETGKVRHVVKKLDSPSESIKFVSLAGVRQRLQEDMTVIARITKEKELGVFRIDGVLQSRFSMSGNRNYWYDAKNKKIYEVIPPASKAAPQKP